ncbi:MAG TPA: hypothetical protein VFT99_01495, partial [Roseiflexaceae bacterium]|nr:hypothetical protein [Roseiflexaceae bacterium]
MAYRPPTELDTLTWLLTQPGCVRCGAPDAATQAVCRACSQPQTSIVRPPVRSTAVSALAGLWVVGALVAALLLVGAWLQVTGRMPLVARQSDSQIMKSLARILGLAALDAPIQSPAPPAWFLPAMLALLLVAAAMAGGMLARTPWAWYAGLGL